MNKGQLIDAVQKNLGSDASRASADAALNAVIDSITKAVKKENVQIIGFGTFSVCFLYPSDAADDTLCVVPGVSGSGYHKKTHQ